MSDATILIRAALDAGVHLKFEDGKIKACGRTDVVSLWAPRLRPHKAELLKALAPAEPAANPGDWKELAAAYHAHHFRCAVCAAAGRGARYGLRCGAGAALWSAYQNTGGAK